MKYAHYNIAHVIRRNTLNKLHFIYKIYIYIYVTKYTPVYSIYVDNITYYQLNIKQTLSPFLLTYCYIIIDIYYNYIKQT